MSYYAALAGELRTRKCSEVQVRDALTAVHEATARSGRTPDEEFGPAKQYAERFSGTRTRTQVHVLRYLTLPTAIVAVILLRVFVFPDIEFLPWGALLGAGVFVAVWVLSEIVASLVNRRIPSGIKVPSTV
jgi:hypothetical protein